MKIEGYILIHDFLMAKTGLARAGIYIRNTINYKVHPDLSNPLEAHVAISIYTSQNRKINLHTWYRQWQEVDATAKIPNTGSVTAPPKKKSNSQLKNSKYPKIKLKP